MHRATRAALQIHQTQIGQMTVERDPFGRTKGALAATPQVAGHL